MDPVTLAIAKNRLGLVSVKDFGARGDGVADDTESIQSALNATPMGGVCLVPPGTYRVTDTLVVPERVTLLGVGKPLILMDDAWSSSYPVEWRGTQIYPIITNSHPAEGETVSGVTIKGLRVEGSRNTYYPNRLAGVLLANAVDSRIEDVDCDYINFFPEEAAQATGGRGFNIATIRSENIEIVNCSGSYAGYEVFGLYDGSKRIRMTNIRSGIGWRTSVQIHRGCEDVQINGMRIRQNWPDEAHAAFTLHGAEGQEVRNISINNLDVEAHITYSESRGALQIFGPNDDVRITNFRVVSHGANGIHVTSERLFLSNGYVSSDVNALDSECSELHVANVALESAGVMMRVVRLRYDHGPARFTNVSARFSAEVSGRALSAGATDHSLTLTGCYFAGGALGEPAIRLSGSSGGVTISGCEIRSDSSTAVHILAGRDMVNNVTISSCRLYAEPSSSAVLIDGEIIGPVVTGNIVQRASFGVTLRNGADKATIVGNNLSGASTPIDASTGTHTIEGNTL